MSFAKIAEARAVKKIVAYLRQEAAAFEPTAEGPWAMIAARKVGAEVLREMAGRVEAGKWKDVKLPKKPQPRKKARK
jgi:hypothetical protein